MDPIYNISTKAQYVNIKNNPVAAIWIEFSTYVSNVTDNDVFKIYKFEIAMGDFDADAFEEAGGEIMNYMTNDLFMGSQLFMGGYEIDSHPEELDISINMAQGTNRIIDLEVRKGYVYIYQFVYIYAGSLYSFTLTDTISESKLAEKIEDQENIVAIRYRNQMRRAPIPYVERNDDNFEIEQDLKLLYNGDIDFALQVEGLKEESETLPKLYDIEDKIGILIQNVDLFGYGVGKYGRNGGYGL